MGGSGAVVASVAAAVTALIAGLWGVRQAKAATNPTATLSTAYSTLFDDLRAEIERRDADHRAELARVDGAHRAELGRVHAEIAASRAAEARCVEEMRAAQLELSALRLRVAHLENKEN